MSQQQSALDCIRSSIASTVRALRLALLALIMAPHVACKFVKFRDLRFPNRIAEV